mgnify:CR=1 FL=1
MAETPPTPPTAPTPEPVAPSRGADLRGATRLATDATAGLANLVEAMHERIARLPGSDAALDGRTSGISGLVYKTIRGVTRVAGGSIEALLGLIAPALGHYAEAAERDALVSALNGVLGDYLVASGNPLAELNKRRLEMDTAKDIMDKANKKYEEAKETEKSLPNEKQIVTKSSFKIYEISKEDFEKKEQAYKEELQRLTTISAAANQPNQ